MEQLRYWPLNSTIGALVLALLLAIPSAQGQETDPQEQVPAKRYEFHGFAAQGYIDTDNNNFYGESRDGSFDYYDIGLNGLWKITDRLSTAGQLLIREAGETDDGKLRVDYAFIDYRFISLDAANAGLRLGRVKNPLGFYNETRDVVFTRPSILLPESVYLEALGLRALLFSSDGIQLYSDWDHGNHHTAFKLNIAESDTAPKRVRKNFFTDTELPPGGALDDVQTEDLLIVQILDEIDGGKLRYALGYASTTLDFIFTPAAFPPLAVDAESITLSGQYNREKWSLTSEYSLLTLDFESFGTTDTVRNEGIYVQSQYRHTPDWTSLLRYDLSYADRNNRGNSDARDVVAGLSWSPTLNWIVMGEYHYIHGSNGAANVPIADNRGRQLEPRTNLLALMAGYRF